MKATTVKLALHCTSLVLAVAALIVCGPAAQHSASWIFELPPAAAAVIWDAAELLTRYIRCRGGNNNTRDGGGIHPGAHVAAHLLLCGGFTTSTVFVLSSVLINWAYTPGYSITTDGTEVGATYSYPSAVSDTALGLDTALSALGLALAVIHFVLFCWACRDTHVRRREASRAAVEGGVEKGDNSDSSVLTAGVYERK